MQRTCISTQSTMMNRIVPEHMPQNKITYNDRSLVIWAPMYFLKYDLSLPVHIVCVSVKENKLVKKIIGFSLQIFPDKFWS